MRRRLEQLWALAPWERRLLVRLVMLLPAIGAALHLLGFKRTRDLLARLAPTSGGRNQGAAESTADEAQRIARLVGIAAHHGPYRATCLRQSLALWWLLRHRGIPVELRLGVCMDGGELQAHAWVEHEGMALSGGSDLSSRFAAFHGL